MAGISADLINPFLMAATSIMKDICQTDMSIGKPYVKTTRVRGGNGCDYDRYYR